MKYLLLHSLARVSGERARKTSEGLWTTLQPRRPHAGPGHAEEPRRSRLVDGIALIRGLQEHERHPECTGIAPGPLRDPPRQRLPVDRHAEAAAEALLRVAFVQGRFRVLCEGLLEGRPHRGRYSTTFPHAGQALDEPIARNEALHAPRL